MRAEPVSAAAAAAAAKASSRSIFRVYYLVFHFYDIWFSVQGVAYGGSCLKYADMANFCPAVTGRPGVFNPVRGLGFGL